MIVLRFINILNRALSIANDDKIFELLRLASHVVCDPSDYDRYDNRHDLKGDFNELPVHILKIHLTPPAI